MTLTSHTTVASGDIQPQALEALIASHQQAVEADRAAWERVGDIEERLELSGLELPKVVTSYLLSFSGDGEVRTPRYSYSEEEITKVMMRHMEDQLSVIHPKAVDVRAKVEKRNKAALADKLGDFRHQKAEFDRREREAGKADAVAVAGATMDEVKSLEAQIVAYVPQTLSEAARKAAWCTWAYREDFCYLSNGPDESVLLEALEAIGRAA